MAAPLCREARLWPPGERQPQLFVSWPWLAWVKRDDDQVKFQSLMDCLSSHFEGGLSDVDRRQTSRARHSNVCSRTRHRHDLERPYDGLSRRLLNPLGFGRLRQIEPSTSPSGAGVADDKLPSVSRCPISVPRRTPLGHISCFSVHDEHHNRRLCVQYQHEKQARYPLTYHGALPQRHRSKIRVPVAPVACRRLEMPDCASTR
jgi:hypothetical protein